MQLRTHASFVKNFHTFQRCTFYGASGAMISMVGIMLALVPVARMFRESFRNVLGEDFSKGLPGVLVPLVASSPVVLFYLWIHKRTKKLELQCHECRHLFNTYSVFERVRDSGLCPKCGTQQFCDAEQFLQSSLVGVGTGPTVHQSLQAALVCALLLFSSGALLIFSWFLGSGVQWLAAGIVTILGGFWYLQRRGRFRRRHANTTIVKQNAEPELPKAGF